MGRSVDAFAGDVARGLVLRELRDAAHVPLVAREGLGDERVDVADRLLDRVLAGADRDDVGVVVLAREDRGVHAPHEGRADALHLVRGDLLAVARSAEHDAERATPAAWSRATACAALMQNAG